MVAELRPNEQENEDMRKVVEVVGIGVISFKLVLVPMLNLTNKTGNRRQLQA